MKDFVLKIKEFSQRFVKKSADDSLTAYAAQTTFFVFLSFFPFVILLFLLVNQIDFLRADIVNYLLRIVPGELREFVVYMSDEIGAQNTGSVTVATIIICLWSSGRGIQALTYGLDRIYGVTKRKNYLLSRILGAVYTMVFLVMCILVMVLHVFGSAIAGKIIELKPSLYNGTIVILSLRSLFTFLIFFALLLIIYCRLPGRKSKLKCEVMGAGIAAVCFMVMTQGFSFYMRYLSNASNMYGSMTSLILLMIWMYTSLQIVLYGAQINFFVNERRG